ncbi:flavin reductase [Flagellimonas meridianipacifica]|uniref:Flavin reductase (DIM6/NTAB) family NADH-FMN oxidoreductase RutF n=1 Tax=Flagellimonas meridianipacifica TaxID=1080225 RepID=A0A2T0MAV9_9FLAO|nr:flavin reductase [Allomuricauda pacifica]PRX54646.1 flavin reductase (DIM6/NTAB) family NADH-FMN oxidoreductase RutF [Allomuricauda pacifica]
MKKLEKEKLVSLDMNFPIWDFIYTVAPLIVVGTKENDGYSLAPKHMATPLGLDNYFGFVCTPRHGTYGNIKRTKEFTISFLKPNQVITASLSASLRDGTMSKSKGIIQALPIVKATTVDAPLVKDAYLYFECELFKIIDGFAGNSIITGKIKKAYVEKQYLRLSDQDEQEQLKENHLLAYIANGRFAKICETYNFPFPKDFKR